ncbi:hypothetical protein [Thermococcus sp. 101 C5]|nr:hypothetical protein [Thermococcus sp. 101 C5]
MAFLMGQPFLLLQFRGVRLVEKKKKTKITKISFPPSALEFLEKK